MAQFLSRAADVTSDRTCWLVFASTSVYTDAMEISPPVIRHDWTVADAVELMSRPLMALLLDAQTAHVARFAPADDGSHQVEGAQLLSIKTGACPEDCAYCPQSAHHETQLSPERLMDTASILAEAEQAKENGASRFCMGAAWRSPTDRQVDEVAAAVSGVGELGLETCVTLGMLTEPQANTLAAAGLDFYNHNLDTSPEFYGTIITTRTYEDRLETLDNCRSAGLSLCAGGIVGMGESRGDRAGLLTQLAALDPHPESVPINLLVKVPGTPLEKVEGQSLADGFGLELVRTVAGARLMMPSSIVRLSAGREEMSDELHALCFMAGANSIFLGDRLLTTDNPGRNDDALMERLGVQVSDRPLVS